MPGRRIRNDMIYVETWSINKYVLGISYVMEGTFPSLLVASISESVFSRLFYSDKVDSNANSVTKPLLNSLAASVLATNNPPPLLGPCQSSCAYNLSIKAPAFDCKKPVLVSFDVLPDVAFYRAYLNYNDSNSNISSSQPLFTVSWKTYNAQNSLPDNGTAVHSTTPYQLQCGFVMADYILHIVYNGGTRIIQPSFKPTVTEMRWRPDLDINGQNNSLGTTADSSGFKQNFTMAQAYSLIQAATIQISGSYIWCEFQYCQ